MSFGGVCTIILNVLHDVASIVDGCRWCAWRVVAWVVAAFFVGVWRRFSWVCGGGFRGCVGWYVFLFSCVCGSARGSPAGGSVGACVWVAGFLGRLLGCFGGVLGVCAGRSFFAVCSPVLGKGVIGYF